MAQSISTFVLVYKNNIISPILTTTREYGRWLEEYYDNSIANIELYLKSKKQDGTTVLESHPGTRIGNWFDKQRFNSTDYESWFILQDSTMMDRLVKYKLAEKRDAIPISVNDGKHRKMIRAYTIKQIELYIQSNIDSSFSIADKTLKPKQVVIQDSDFDKLIMPEIKNRRKALF